MGRSLVRGASAFVSSLICLVVVLGASPGLGAGLHALRTTADQEAIFPISIASSKRHLQDASGRPFLIQGDTAWSLIAGPTHADVHPVGR